MARQKKIDLEHMTEKEKMKYEIAGELGLLERVLNDGWRSLTAKETGRIGGLVTRRTVSYTHLFRVDRIPLRQEIPSLS